MPDIARQMATRAADRETDDHADTPESAPTPASKPSRRPLEEVIPWEEYLMALTFLTARRSDSIVTKTGCGSSIGPRLYTAGAVIIRGMSTEGQGVKKIVGIGYATPSKGCEGDESCEDKYVCSAVVNAIVNKNAEDLTGCTLFTTHFPSSDDAKLIIQAGIRRIVYYHEDLMHEQDRKRGGIPQIMFDKVGVNCTSFKAFRQMCIEQHIILHLKRAEHHQNSARRCYARGETTMAEDHRKRFGECNDDVEYEQQYCGRKPRNVQLYPSKDLPEAKKNLASNDAYVSDDDYYMAVALLSAQRSKDDSRQVGACIVDKSKMIVGIGYNGWPYGISDNDPEIPWGKGEKYNKYGYVVHAEANAIMHKTCIDLEGCTIYTTLFPCNECAKLIIQSGIMTVYYLSDAHHDKPGTELSRELLRKAGYILDQDPPPAKRPRQGRRKECRQYIPQCNIQVDFEPLVHEKDTIQKKLTHRLV